MWPTFTSSWIFHAKPVSSLNLDRWCSPGCPILAVHFLIPCPLELHGLSFLSIFYFSLWRALSRISSLSLEIAKQFFLSSENHPHRVFSGCPTWARRPLLIFSVLVPGEFWVLYVLSIPLPFSQLFPDLPPLLYPHFWDKIWLYSQTILNFLYRPVWSWTQRSICPPLLPQYHETFQDKMCFSNIFGFFFLPLEHDQFNGGYIVRENSLYQ